MRTGSLPLWIASVALLAAPAHAVDGVREINQTCATTTGCFVGDSAGFPVTITQSGSYRLTSNLLLPNANANGIAAATADVSIDLNGFAVSGVTTCSGAPTTCTDTGTGKGIASGSATVRGLSVRNGTVARMGAVGIFLGESGQVQDVRAVSNGSYGISGSNGVQVLRCAVERNGQGGILAGANALVADNTVQLSGGTAAGISVTSGVVRGNSVNGGASHGIQGGDGTTIVDNSSVSNGGRGIWSGAASTISRNSVYGPPNGDIGVSATAARISENSILSHLNGGVPIAGAGDSGCSGNVLFTIGGGTYISGCVDLGDNVCNGAPCP